MAAVAPLTHWTEMADVGRQTRNSLGWYASVNGVYPHVFPPSVIRAPSGLEWIVKVTVFDPHADSVPVVEASARATSARINRETFIGSSKGYFAGMSSFVNPIAASTASLRGFSRQNFDTQWVAAAGSGG